MKIAVVLLITALASAGAYTHAAGSVAQHSVASASDISPATKKNDRRGSASEPVYVVSVESASEAARKALSDHLQAQDTAASQLVMFFTGGMLLIAVAQAFLFLWQLKLMRESLRAAASAAKSAESSVEIMRDTAERQLRAYITVDTAKIEFPDPGRPKSIVNYKNAGQTPAYDVQIWIHQWIACFPMGCDLPQPPDDFVMAKAVLGPGAFNTMVTEAPQPLVKEQFLELVGTPQGTIYVYGEISYRDVFGHKHLHKYKFMHGGSEPNIPGMLKPCIDGNESD